MNSHDGVLLPSPNQPAGLTDWPNEPTAQLLKQDFEAAKPAHDSQVSKITKWNDLMFIRGKEKPPKVAGRSAIQPKLVRRQAEWRYAALSEPFLGASRLYSISPVTWEDKPAAIQNELLLNWQFRTKLNKVKFIDDYVRSTVDEGTCIVQVGWCRETRMEEQMVPVWEFYAIAPEDVQSLEQLQQALQFKAENPNGYLQQVPEELQQAVDYYNETGVPTTAVSIWQEQVSAEKVVTNHPTVTVINPNNFYPDPSCNGDFSKALFSIVSFETYKAELAKYPERYQNLEKVNWEGNSPITDTDHVSGTPDDFQFSDKKRKKVVAYEYWGSHDIYGDGNLVPIVATWIGDVIVRMELNPFPDQKIPFVLVPYLPVKRELFGEPDAELLEENQKILGAVTRGMIDSMGRSANAQQGIAKGMLDPLNRRRFDRGEDYEFNAGVAGPNPGIIEHAYPELPASALTMVMLQNQEAEAITGVKAFAGGISGNSYGDVATGVRGALDAASKREMGILRRLAQGIIDIGNKIIAMNSIFLSDAEVIRVTNSEFVTIRREDLSGNFDLDVDISTAEVDTQKAQDLGFMVQTVGPNTDPQIMLMMLAEIARLKRMPTLSHAIATYQPQPDPLAVKAQELELAKLEAEIAKLNAETQKAQADARATMTEADLNNLSFVEQETGTKHARDLEKQRAQASGNQDLQITKALSQPTKSSEQSGNIDAAIGYNLLSQSRDNS